MSDVLIKRMSMIAGQIEWSNFVSGIARASSEFNVGVGNGFGSNCLDQHQQNLAMAWRKDGRPSAAVLQLL